MTDDRETGSEDVTGTDRPAEQVHRPAHRADGVPDPGASTPAGTHAGSDRPNAADAGTTSPPGDVTDGSAAASGAEAPVSDAPPTDESRWQRRRREKAATPRRKAPWWELPVLVLVAIGIAILVKSFVVQPFYIPSESMEKTLHGCDGCSGDRILVNKPIYSVLRDPEPGDIVVFDAPPGWDAEGPTETSGNIVTKAVRGFGQLIGFVPPDGEVLVKRVIAVGGQTVRGVEVTTSSGRVDDRIQISSSGPDGPWRTLQEPYTYRDAQHGDERKFGPVTVPKGRLWVMGDHRNDSSDSRYHCSPGGESTAADDNCNPVSSTVPIDNVIGKAMVIAWPPSRWRTLGTPSTFDSAADVAGPGLPAAAALATVVPVSLVRRRRRRTR